MNMRHFSYKHLPSHLQTVSEPFGRLANEMYSIILAGDEKEAGMRKLLEAKDCFVRAKLEEKEGS